MTKKHINFYWLACLFFFSSSPAQVFNVLSDYSFLQRIEAANADTGKASGFTTFKPFPAKASDSLNDFKSLNTSLRFSHSLHKKLFATEISPLINASYGSGSAGDSWRREGGLQIKMAYADKLGIYADASIGEMKVLPYQKTFIDKYGIFPGYGRVLSSNGSAYTYDQWNGYVSYIPASFIHIEAGKGKNFVGDGYRSLLLSDNSASTPFLKITTTLGILSYTNLFTEFSNLPVINNEVQARKKYGAYHFLNLKLGEHFEVGMFEGEIWEGQDSSGKGRGFDINYLNPVVFYRPIEFSRGSPDNAVIGLTGAFKVKNKARFYGQFILDDLNLQMSAKGSGFFQDKYGCQLGAKFFHPFHISNLFVQAEFNTVRPYVYAHKIPLENYSNFNQALAHPLGANFREYLFLFQYFIKRWSIVGEVMYSQYGDDTGNQHNGKDIFSSDYKVNLYSYGNYIGQGISTHLINTDIKIQYSISGTNNLNVFAGWNMRSINSGIQNNQYNFFSVGIKTSIYNQYLDF